MTHSNKRSGILFTLVGPGGAGKNALINAVLQRTDHLRQLATATTRPMRPQEQPGREHMFLSEAEFRKMIDETRLIEWQEVHPGRYYGTPRLPVEKAIANGEDLIADIDVAGAVRLHDIYPDNTVMIFVAPPSLQQLEVRMRERGDSTDQIAERMQRVAMEMDFQNQCDYVIVNSNLDNATKELEHIIAVERAKRLHVIIQES